MTYYYAHTEYAGEPEEDEKKALFILTSLMSKRDHDAHASIYEEFEVSFPYLFIEFQLFIKP